jgi:hypothetical protein
MVKLPVGLLWEPIEPPPHIVNPVLELEPGTWMSWCCDEWVSPDAAAKCEAYMAWCKVEQKRRFDEILEDNGLANEQGEQAKKWKDFALSLAVNYSGLLTSPEPRPPRRRAGKRNVDAAIFEAVAREWERTDEKISVAEAFRRANKGGTWTERQFTLAKARWYKANPQERPPRGRPKRAREA